MQTKQQYKILIGIDPGVHTGFSVYDRVKKQLVRVQTLSIVRAQAALLDDSMKKPIVLKEVLVRMEDARLRTWFGKKGREALQGAGSIKRDCGIWIEFFEFWDIPFELVAPKMVKKVSENVFVQSTGWKGRSSEHSRIASMLVWGF